MFLRVFRYNAVSGLDVRRKNATRESTSTLKTWLFQHIKNPYPTKGEKIMLAIVTRMTLTQVLKSLASVLRHGGVEFLYLGHLKNHLRNVIVMFSKLVLLRLRNYRESYHKLRGKSCEKSEGS